MVFFFERKKLDERIFFNRRNFTKSSKREGVWFHFQSPKILSFKKALSGFFSPSLNKMHFVSKEISLKITLWKFLWERKIAMKIFSFRKIFQASFAIPSRENTRIPFIRAPKLSKNLWSLIKKSISLKDEGKGFISKALLEILFQKGQ